MVGDYEWVTQNFRLSLEALIRDRARRLDSLARYSLYEIVSLCGFLSDIVDSMLWKVGEKYGRKLLFPFFNDVLVAYAFELPWEFKLKEPKYALREVARKIGIPKFIISRPKMGFPTRPEYWALRGKILEPFVALCKDFFSEQDFRRMQSTDTRKSTTLWLMINYALWKKIFIKGESPEELKRKLNC